MNKSYAKRSSGSEYEVIVIEDEDDKGSDDVMITSVEDLSRNSKSLKDDVPLYLHDCSEFPICFKNPKLLTTSEIMNCIVDLELSEPSTCKRVPIAVNCNAVFLVDMSKLGSSRDIACDDMESWKWGGSYRRWLSVDSIGDISVLGKTKTISPDPNLCYYRIWKRYYENKSSPDVKKIIVTIEDLEMITQNIALVQYVFVHDEHEVKITPHGNSLKSEGYFRTMPSMLTSLKKLSGESTAKRALFVASSDVSSAPSASSLPRGRQQVNDMRRGLSKSAGDALFSLMVMCKEGESSKSENAFVRVVNAAPYSMMMLAFDWMLNDVVRLCTVPGNFSVLSVDQTFSLGSFDVTVTTYSQLMLNPKDRKFKHPTMIGPLFIHVRKDFAAYHFFASSLVSQCHELHQLQCFGSDGEAALFKAFSTVFSKALHLRCFLHFRENLERKLRELNIPTETVKEFVRDVFGCVASRQRDLVDAKDGVELEDMFSSAEQKWNDREKKFSSPPVFHTWFGEYCLDVVRCSMMASVREQAGLGSPPEPFYTNAVESKNNVLKQHLNRMSSSLPEFVEGMKTLLQQQYQEIQKAVPSMGEYRIASSYMYLAYDHQKWFKMSTKQRQAKISQFMKHSLQPVTCTDMQQRDSPLTELGLPPHIAKIIWFRPDAMDAKERLQEVLMVNHSLP